MCVDEREYDDGSWDSREKRQLLIEQKTTVRDVEGLQLSIF